LSLQTVRRWFREPALQFLLIGGAIFGLHALVRPTSGRGDISWIIRVSRDDLQRLRDGHFALTGKMPTPEEERRIVERYVSDEVLYREALALGLDKGDSVVRGRLAQKMQFLSEDLHAVAEPTEGELEDFLKSSPRYIQPRKMTLEHLFFSRDRRGERARSDAQAGLSKLENASSESALSRGDPFMLGRRFADRSETDLAGLFGPSFAKEVSTLPAGVWSGPIESSYGAHLVRVERITPSTIPPLEVVRDRVRLDLLQLRREEANRAMVRKLSEKYKVEIETAPTLSTAEAR
jgi:peptidyl-prolyl cis-trans isomerase C